MRNARQLLFYSLVAAVNILSTLAPVWPGRYELLGRFVNPTLILGAENVALFAGVGMLLLAYPAAEGHRRAAHLMMLCAGIAALANVLKGLDVEEALINGALLMTLWRGRARLHSIPLRYTPVDLVRLGVALLVILRVYTLTERALLNALRLLLEQGETSVPLLNRAIHLLTAKLELQHTWFHESQLLLPVFLLGIFLVISWTSLARSVESYGGDLYERFGRASHNSLAYIARRHDVATFLDSEGRGAITYRRVGRVALQLGAMLAPEEQRAAVYSAFLAFCRTQRLIPAAVALTTEERAIACAAGLRAINIGSEAVVDLRSFAVEQLNKKMRWAQRSLAKRGYTTRLCAATEITAQARVALDRIDAEWRADRGGKTFGCCMTLGRFPTREDAECLIAVAHDETGAPVAYLTLLPGGQGYYSLDLTRRAHAAPNAIMEFLLMEALSQLRERGAAATSLNFSTFASLGQARGGERALALLGKAFQLRSLEAFNAKFKPGWEPRYLVCPSWLALPDVIYAIAIVEGLDRMLYNALIRSAREVTHPSGGRAPEPRLLGEGA